MGSVIIGECDFFDIVSDLGRIGCIKSETKSKEEYSYEQPDLIIFLRFVETMNEVNEK